jgi:hypothetical protein
MNTNSNDIDENKTSYEIKKKNKTIVVKKELNYKRIKNIVKKSKNSQKYDNLKIIKIIISKFHYKIVCRTRDIFDFLFL